MRGSIGQILLQRGVIDAAGLSDALAHQAQRHPVASELYALGYASERQLCSALATQTGWSAVVLDESTIRLDVLEHVSPEWARTFRALVVHEDAETIVIAAARPEDAIVPARELAGARGKHVELRIALEATLARTIRVAFRKWKHGELYLAGPEVEGGERGARLALVHPEGHADEHRRAQRALAEEAARNLDELPPEDLGASLTGDWNANTATSVEHEAFEEYTLVIASQIDRGLERSLERAGAAAAIEATLETTVDTTLEPSTARGRALVVDPDPHHRIQLVSELERLGHECQAAANGAQAIELLSAIEFEVVFADVATPELDGLRLCRAIKCSRRLARCRVVVTTSVVDSGQIADEVLQRHAVDGYLEKPLDRRRLHRLLRELSTEERADHELLLADALGRYHAGDVDGAIGRLRGALAGDPASPKLHFMLANMLQRSSRWAEAVDEYEAVVDLQPVYFPALTRLAYLYFRQGLHARAVETWRRALPVCEDPALRRNIELFMRKLVADLSKSDSA
ncbi:MAG: response regulator [Kofleriaceae bacterium]